MGKRITNDRIQYSTEYEGWIVLNQTKTDFFGPFSTKAEATKVYNRLFKYNEKKSI